MKVVLRAWICIGKFLHGIGLFVIINCTKLVHAFLFFYNSQFLFILLIPILKHSLSLFICFHGSSCLGWSCVLPQGVGEPAGSLYCCHGLHVFLPMLCGCIIITPIVAWLLEYDCANLFMLCIGGEQPWGDFEPGVWGQSVKTRLSELLWWPSECSKVDHWWYF